MSATRVRIREATPFVSVSPPENGCRLVYACVETRKVFFPLSSAWCCILSSNAWLLGRWVFAAVVDWVMV